eukprot:Gb_10804 [translate_table: standard]
MDGDGRSEFDNICNSIVTKLEALRSIHASDQLRKHTANTECNTKAVDCQFSSGMTTVANAVGSSHSNAVCLPDIRLEQVSDFTKEKNSVGFSAQVSENIQESKKDHALHLPEKVTANDHGRDDQRSGMALKDVGKEKENSPGRSPQPMEVPREQARRWVYEEVIGVFEEQCGEASKIDAPISSNEHNNYMSDLVGNMGKVLKERVEKVDIEARKVVELREALSAEKSVVKTMQQKQHFLRGVLYRALNTSENGIFMCNQCQLIVEKVKELCHRIEKDSKAIRGQLIPKETRGTCDNGNNLQSNKDSTMTSINFILDRDAGEKDNLVNPVIQSINVSRKIWTKTLNETHQMLCGNIWGTTISKPVNVNDTRLDLERDRSTFANSEPLLKRKLLYNDCVEEAQPAKAPKVSTQTPQVPCPNGSQDLNSPNTSEMKFVTTFHYDTVGEPDLTCDHNKTEDDGHSVGQAGTFTLLLEEEFNDDLE